ncbi:orotidine-5'-phosphate decarboxylase [Thiohalobacter sp. IOR34]|uniref:orotidine-5'-phosphate decarboxylase n=1 Tax=Thiohalobacter sp. IOR34 TaxID=3057176 RepID=UPI0025B172A1|nr:orotidine-5'-phosphate decarboxylase [Thiohalobacter sp. IOR34]WJW76696.1 orotidine-5'-phosphate decarboxylase [Thiohalobacter sp. IOR34]
MVNNDPKVIVALDFATAREAEALVERLDPALCRLKVGKELFTRSGPALVESLAGRGFDVFLDLKFHDIPNTVARACAAAADLGVWMVNVHCLGGRRMMAAAREALDQAAGRRPLLIGVTILTSMGPEDLAEIGLSDDPAAQVRRLAELARQAGLDGVVCSPQEAGMLREALGDDFLLVTPGVRPAGSEKGDQRRVMTPADALAAGSDYLVIGRPVTRATDPIAALETINRELADATRPVPHP